MPYFIYSNIQKFRVSQNYLFIIIFYESNGFIQQEHIKLIKHDKTNIYNVQFLFQIAAL